MKYLGKTIVSVAICTIAIAALKVDMCCGLILSICCLGTVGAIWKVK
jgi:hypothetical protein